MNEIIQCWGESDNTPPSLCPIDPECTGHSSMLGVSIDFSLHHHQLRENLQVGNEFKLVVLSNPCECILVNSHSQL